MGTVGLYAESIYTVIACVIVKPESKMVEVLITFNDDSDRDVDEPSKRQT